MKLRQILNTCLLIASCLILLLLACSEGESPSGTDGSGVSPLTEDFYPLPASGTWEYVRVEQGVWDLIEQYYNTNIPAAHTTVTVETPAGGDADERVFTGTTVTAEVDTLQYKTVFSVRKTANGFDFTGQNEEASFDSSHVFTEAGLPHAWYRFGQVRWESWLVDYANESMNQDYYGEEQGKVLLSNAIGFRYPRLVYDGGDAAEGKYDNSDVDHDTYLDGIPWVKLVGEVISETDFAYADIPFAEEIFPPELQNKVYSDCKVVRFSLETAVFFSNQRDPNTQQGQSGINEEYLAGLAYTDPGRRDLATVVLARGVGPVLISSYVDLDKRIMAGDPNPSVRLFQGDLLQHDILLSFTDE